MPYSTENSYGRGGRDSGRNGRRHSGPNRDSWRDSMERGVATNGGSMNGSYRKSYSNGHTTPSVASGEAPTLPRRTLRGQPPPGARKAKPRGRRRPIADHRSWTIGLYIALTCSGLSLVLLATAFGTSYWLETTVDRETLTEASRTSLKLKRQLETDLLYRSSHRGLLTTCWESIEEGESDFCESEKGYELSRRAETRSWGTDYDLYIHIMRLVFVCLILALLFELSAIMCSLFGCVRRSRKPLFITVALSFFAFLFACGGMGSFHGVDFYETQRIYQEPFPVDWPNSHPKLAENYKRNFGYSYFLGWVGTALAFVAMIGFITSYVMLVQLKAPMRARPKEHVYVNSAASPGTLSRGGRGGGRGRGRGRGGKGPRALSLRSDEADTYYTTSSAASRNFAYEMAENDVPPPDELDCIDESIFTSTKL